MAGAGRQDEALPADRAFVVQFRAGAASEPLRRLAGRVEHVRSGTVRHFASLDELLAFLEEALGAARLQAKAARRGAPDE